MYVYIKTERHLYTVGFFAPDGTWIAEGDYASSDEAAQRVAYLNGGGDHYLDLTKRVTALEDAPRQFAESAYRIGQRISSQFPQS